MFSTLAKCAVKPIYNMRTLYWVVKRGEYKYIGLDATAIDIYEGVKNIHYPNVDMVLKGDTLFKVNSDSFVDGVFTSKKDTYIVDKNETIMKTLNTAPEHVKDSWILKIRDIEPESKSYSKFLIKNPNATKQERRNAIKDYLDSTRYTPYTYYSSPNDYKTNHSKNHTIKKNIYDSQYHTNANENDLISYIMSNH